jgi:hypothetical protein
MKKTIAILLCVLLLSVSTATFAAGKLSVVQENFHVISSLWTNGYVYAKVTNAGDKPTKINAGVLEIYDDAGEVIASSDYLSAYAEYLEPGQYTYVKMYSEIKSGTASDYNFTLTNKTDNSKRTLRLPVETDLQLDVKSGWWTYNYMYATVTNDTEEALYGIKVVLALLDAEGNILNIEDDSLYTDRALTPGSSLIIRKDISSAFMDYYKAKGIVPVAVDAIAYVNVDAN